MVSPGNDRFVSYGGGRFPTTLWTQIKDPACRELVKGELFKQYYNPLYVFCRRRGFSSDDAAEYVQGFLAEILVGRDFLSKADRERGRLRSLLVKSLNNYINTMLRKNRVRPGSVDDLSEHDIPEEPPIEPTAAFDYTASVVKSGINQK